MALYKLPKIIGRDNKPPFGARINPHHPLSKGLVGVWLFNEGGGPFAYDIFMHNGSLPSAVAWMGNGLSFSGTGCISVGAIRYIISYLTGYSIVSCVKTNTLSGEHALMADWDTATNAILWEQSGSNVLIYNQLFGGSLALSSSNGVFAIGEIATFAVTWESNVAHVLYKNGTILPPGYTVTVAGYIPDGTSTLYIGGQLGGKYWDGEIYYTYIYNRVLTAAEIASLYANPYQMFIHPVWDAYYVSAAAPPPTGGKSIFGYDSIFHAGGIIQT